VYIDYGIVLVLVLKNANKSNDHKLEQIVYIGVNVNFSSNYRKNIRQNSLDYLGLCLHRQWYFSKTNNNNKMRCWEELVHMTSSIARSKRKLDTTLECCVTWVHANF